MRCYACNAEDSKNFDGATERYYCNVCHNIIFKELISGLDQGTIEVEEEKETLDEFLYRSDTPDVSEM